MGKTEGEAASPSREPDAGLCPKTLGSGLEQKAATQQTEPRRRPGIHGLKDTGKTCGTRGGGSLS